MQICCIMSSRSRATAVIVRVQQLLHLLLVQMLVVCSVQLLQQ
jgi:hypothetical protein